MFKLGWIIAAALALVACSESGGDVGAGGSGGGGPPEPYPTCRYENPFSMAAECRGYFGENWTETAIAENCSEPFTSVVGELSEGFCEPEGAIGTCTEDPGGPLLLVTWFYGGDPGATQSACEGFAGGVWSEDTSAPDRRPPMGADVMPEAIDAMASNEEVSVSPPDCADGGCLDALIDDDGAIVFTPTAGAPTTGVIIYPGALVDPRAYAPTAQAIAREGYLVALVPMEGMLAFNGVDRADDVIAAEPGISNWFLAGHSMGGVSAARYVAQAGGAIPIDGLILWASFPSMEDDISSAALAATSIFGSRDELSTVEEIDDSKALLPPDTRYAEIPGGNHGQFGYYGEQEGDGEPFIEREAQQQMIVGATLHFVRTVIDGAVPEHPGFAEAEALGASRCTEAQRIVANVSPAALPDGSIDNEIIQDPRAFGESKASVDASATSPLAITSHLRSAGNGTALFAPPVYVTELWCKLKNQESLVQELGLGTLGGPQVCADVNRATLDWALAQLTSGERADYDARGLIVTFGPDDEKTTGVQWFTEGEVVVNQLAGELEVISSSLPVPLSADAPDEFLGVHYCKLWSPADALRFVLE